MTPLPIAHAGHVLVDSLYVLPLLVAVGVLVTQSWREKRREKREGPRERRPPEAPPAA